MKSLPLKTLEIQEKVAGFSEAPTDSPFIQSFDNKDVVEEVNKSLTKGKCSTQSSVRSTQWKPFRVPKIGESDLVVSTLQVPAEPEFARDIYTSSGHMENVTNPTNMLANPIKVDANCNMLNPKTDVPNVDSAHPTAKDQPLTIAHIQGREADIRVMSELNRALDKKDIDGAQKYERHHIGKQKWRMLYKRMPLIKSTEPENGSISYQKHLDSKLPRNSKQVPSELITSCVATLLMIRERFAIGEQKQGYWMPQESPARTARASFSACCLSVITSSDLRELAGLSQSGDAPSSMGEPFWNWLGMSTIILARIQLGSIDHVSFPTVRGLLMLLWLV
ncbi:hypothetical protein V6N12_014966 [Hibiscus sabdariffa]|uniref:Uncharacterized protein n=1 Tax=Hibiscus sabdariffa TaxID=183260 RepID=A0ABR2DLR5_9ROSI